MIVKGELLLLDAKLDMEVGLLLLNNELSVEVRLLLDASELNLGGGLRHH